MVTVTITNLAVPAFKSNSVRVFLKETEVIGYEVTKVTKTYSLMYYLHKMTVCYEIYVYIHSLYMYIYIYMCVCDFCRFNLSIMEKAVSLIELNQVIV